MILFFLALVFPAQGKAFDYTDAAVTTSIVASVAAMPTWEKRGMAAATHAASAVINYGLKNLFARPCRSFAERPDQSDCLGMPSGHNQTTWTSAGLLCREYGGLPCAGGVALGITTLVGRVQLNRHTKEQVAIGAGLGFGAGYYGATLTGVW